MSGALERIKDRFPEGIPTEVDGDTLAELIEAAGTRLERDKFILDLTEVAEAIENNDNLRGLTLLVSLLTKLGLTVG